MEWLFIHRSTRGIVGRDGGDLLRAANFCVKHRNVDFGAASVFGHHRFTLLAEMRIAVPLGTADGAHQRRGEAVETGGAHRHRLRAVGDISRSILRPRRRPDARPQRSSAKRDLEFLPMSGLYHA